MPTQWAIDFGTTNSVVAVAEEGSVRLAHLPEISRSLPTEQSPLIPTAVHITEDLQRRFWFFHRRVRQVFIGQQALSRNFDGRGHGFAQSFKRHLGNQSHRTVARAGNSELSAREVAHLFLKELLTVSAREFHCRVTDLTIPAPVGYYDNYRAELQALASRLGVKRFRTLDEPVAAALGYGVNVAREEILLVVDFGGGTLNLAAIQLGGHTAQTGAAPVLAKHMVALGGEDVDRWIMERLVPGGLHDMPEWQTDLRWEAMWLKERVSREGNGEFRWGGLRYSMNRADLVRLLAERGLYDQLRTALAEIQRELQATPGVSSPKVDEVLMSGGSTLLPEVAAVVDDVFPQAVVRHDPAFVFTSVAMGAARFAGGVAVDDFVYHDYAVAVQNERTHTVEYELLIPRRTRYPTAPDFAVRYYADFPGMSEMRFSVCEVGRLGQAPVDWQGRPNGNRYWAPQTEDERALVLELNPADSPLPLRPAGQGASPRLRVIYTINHDRWLCTTVEDLVTKRPLKVNEPVVRLR
ncbi:MAG TPA: Hsp70 family protein [Armatimonadota bacterium]|nr:Hsp70 family protein [Armatimonadota bacterium]